MTASLALRPTLYEETVPGGGHTSFILKRGQLLRIIDIEGGANVSLLLLNAPWQFDRLMQPAMAAMADALGETGASTRVEWLKAPL